MTDTLGYGARCAASDHPMIDQIVVVVPARNEQAALPACLHSLRQAVQEAKICRPDVDVQLVVVLDGCTDGSLELLRGAADVEVLQVLARTAGGARAAGTEHALRLAGCAPSRLWIASTDADSQVPRDWLVQMLADAERGTHVVLGTVEPDADLEPALRKLWRERHRLVEGHAHVHGANFGIRADIYLGLGGWTALASGEDIALAARANREPHVRIRRTSRIPVITSSRRTARAPHGFSVYLADLAAEAR